MKSSSLLRVLTTAVAILLAFASCDKPDPVTDPEQPEQEQPGNTDGEDPGEENPGEDNPGGDDTDADKPLEPNTYSIKGETYTYGSIGAGMVETYLSIGATPTEGLSDYYDIISEDEVVYILVTAPLNGQEFDIMTETKDFSIGVYLGDTYLEAAPGYADGITGGKCRFESSDGKVTASIEMTLTDGTTFRSLMDIEADLNVNENTLVRNGEVKPVNACFSLVEDGLTSLYFTPADVEWFDDMVDNATWYTYITLEDSCCDGTDINATDLLMAGINDNMNYDMSISNYDVEVSGTVNVKRDSENPYHYTVSAELTFGEQTITIHFDGEATDAYAEPEKENKYVYNDEDVILTEATIDKTSVEGLWVLALKAEDGDDVLIYMPADDYDGEAHGFSQNKDYKVVLGDRTFNKANGDSGTIIVSINEEKSTVTAEFTDYDSLEVYYKGTYSTL